MMLPLLHNSHAPATSSLHNTQLGHDDDGLSFPPFLMKIDDDEATEGRRLLSMVRGGFFEVGGRERLVPSIYPTLQLLLFVFSINCFGFVGLVSSDECEHP